MMGRALAVQADAMRLPLPDASADLVVTSPPYLWKRKYAIQHPGEIGNEPNWRLYLANLYAATDEMLRVLKPTGSIWVNLGDTRVTGREPKWLGVPVKSRLLLPERYRVGCQDRYSARGVIVRQVQIHDKANGLPESIDDRTRDSHEDWVHIVKRRSYYAALDTLREPTPSHYHDRPQYQRAIQLFDQAGFTEAHMAAVRAVGVIDSGGGQVRSGGSWESESGRLAKQVSERLGSYYRELCGSNTAPLGTWPGSVWNIPSHPLKLPAWLGVDHYAAFSPEWPRRLVLAFSPPGICLECGEGRWPVVERRYDAQGRTTNGPQSVARRHESPGRDVRMVTEATIRGWACSCTPYTDRPGTGEPSGPDKRYGDHLDAGGGYANVGAKFEASDSGHGGLGDRPKVGPGREYHLDGFKAPPTRPAVVLDPFSGVGTTCLVARALGRIGIGVDLSHAYSRAARWRVFESGEWQDIIAKTTGRRVKPLPKHDPAQERLAL